MSNLTPLGALFEHLVSNCPPYRFPRPWDFVEPDEDCRGPVQDPATVVATLRTHFGPDALVQHGVAQVGPNGPLQLRTEFVKPSGGLIVLRREPSGAPYCLMTDGGCLPRPRLALAAALKDPQTAALLRRSPHRPRRLFLTFQLGDAALLRALGYPAVPAAGLPRPGLRVLRYLNEVFGEHNNKSVRLATTQAVEPVDAASANGRARRATLEGSLTAAAQEQETQAASGPAASTSPGASQGEGRGEAQARPACTLTILGSSIMALKPACDPALPGVCRWLASAARNIGFAFHGVELWQPEASLMENLRYRVGFREPKLIRELLDKEFGRVAPLAWDRWAEPARPAKPARPGKPAPPGYLKAREALIAVQSSDPEDRRRFFAKKADADFNAAVSELVGRLREYGMSCEDPLLANVIPEFADIAGALHMAGPQMTELLMKAIKTGGEYPEVLRAHLDTISRCSRLARDIHTLRRR